MMSTKPERCKIHIVNDSVTGWKLKLEGDCSNTLNQIEALPPRRRRYLKRRIETEI